MQKNSGIKQRTITLRNIPILVLSINPKSIILLPYEILTAIMQIVENELAKGRKL